jgi:hypothetical protein
LVQLGLGLLLRLAVAVASGEFCQIQHIPQTANACVYFTVIIRVHVRQVHQWLVEEEELDTFHTALAVNLCYGLVYATAVTGKKVLAVLVVEIIKKDGVVKYCGRAFRVIVPLVVWEP